MNPVSFSGIKELILLKNKVLNFAQKLQAIRRAEGNDPALNKETPPYVQIVQKLC